MGYRIGAYVTIRLGVHADCHGILRMMRKLNTSMRQYNQVDLQVTAGRNWQCLPRGTLRKASASFLSRPSPPSPSPCIAARRTEHEQFDEGRSLLINASTGNHRKVPKILFYSKASSYNTWVFAVNKVVPCVVRCHAHRHGFKIN